jgi:hypothetical protein
MTVMSSSVTSCCTVGSDELSSAPAMDAQRWAASRELSGRVQRDGREGERERQTETEGERGRGGEREREKERRSGRRARGRAGRLKYALGTARSGRRVRGRAGRLESAGTRTEVQDASATG